MSDTPDNLFLKIKHYVLSNYEPATGLADASISMTTTDVYERLQSLYPSFDYDGEQVAVWLEDWGFIFRNKGPMKPEWLFKKRKNNAETT